MHTIRIISAAAALGAVMINSTAFAQVLADKPFTDVPSSHANFEAVEYLRVNGVLVGYEDGTFKPNARINRAEFVKLITNPFILDTNRINECLTEELDEDDTHVFFSDVRRDAWYAKEVCFAKLKKLIDGYPDNTFQPGNYVIFVEAAKIIAGTFSFQTNAEPEGEKWYVPYVENLDQENAIPATISRFDQTITRGEMAEMLFRLKTHNTTKSSKTYGQLR